MTRGERKERTRQAILDAALELSGHASLATLSLRQVAREVGIVPTAFYRHFDTLDAVGLALVDDAFRSLRAMLRDVRGNDPDFAGIIDRSVDVLVEHVTAQPAHFAFLARERYAGPTPVRAAIRHQIELVERELATDIARLPGTDAWSAEDLRVLANLIVTSMVQTVVDLIEAAERPVDGRAVAERARQQLRLVLVGALHWRTPPPPA